MCGVRAAMQRMDHTFSRARARNDLRLAIKSIRRCEEKAGRNTVGPFGTKVLKSTTPAIHITIATQKERNAALPASHIPRTCSRACNVSCFLRAIVVRILTLYFRRIPIPLPQQQQQQQPLARAGILAVNFNLSTFPSEVPK